MALVEQAPMLGRLLQRVGETWRPQSLAVLGVAGGNGLELLDPAIVRRVVAVDFNPDYLAACAARYAGRFEKFEPVLHNLAVGPPPVAPVECLFAGLVLEYLKLEEFCDWLPSLLLPSGIFAVVLQQPSPDLPEVSASPFTSLAQLQAAFRFVKPRDLHQSLVRRGVDLVSRKEQRLASGKVFHVAQWRRSTQCQ